MNAMPFLRVIHGHPKGEYEVRACGYVDTPYASNPIQKFGPRYYEANSSASEVAK